MKPLRRPQLDPADFLVIDARTGKIRQSGTLGESTDFLVNFKKRAETSLYVFAKEILGYDLLSPTLHKPAADFIQKSPPFRKMMLMPRNHLKTTLAKSLTLHLLVQPARYNIYFEKQIGNSSSRDGRNTRILYASKTADLARAALGEITQKMETGRSAQLLKGFWPHCFWENPRKQARAWNAEKVFLPRDSQDKEGSIETIGVGGVRTGYHFDYNIHDDLIDIRDRNSPAEMATAMEWHTASRAFLQDENTSPELILGTHWAVNDLYSHIQQNDPSVECYIRAIVEDNKPIFPEKYDLQTIQRMTEPPPYGYGVLFPLLFMNNPVDTALVDFDVDNVRSFTIQDNHICFEEDERDTVLADRISSQTEGRPRFRRDYYGRRLDAAMQHEMFNAKEEFLRLNMR